MPGYPMERGGVISGYHAAVDRSVLGKNFVAYTAVGISDHSKSSLEKFEKAVSTSPDVVECHKVTGTVEYILRIEVSDMAAYESFHSNILGAIPNVVSINSHIVIQSISENVRRMRPQIA